MTSEELKEVSLKVLDVAIKGCHENGTLADMLMAIMGAPLLMPQILEVESRDAHEHMLVLCKELVKLLKTIVQES